MKLRDFPILADQNIHADEVAFLRAEGLAVVDVADAQLSGGSDALILTRAVAEGRVVLTHDADFGTLAIAQGAPVVGNVSLRPGHIGPEPTVATLRHLFAVNPDLAPPFVLVAIRTADRVGIRVVRTRHLGIDPFAYLRDVLPRLHALGEQPIDEQLHPLLPDRWLASRPANTSANPTAA